MVHVSLKKNLFGFGKKKSRETIRGPKAIKAYAAGLRDARSPGSYSGPRHATATPDLLNEIAKGQLGKSYKSATPQQQKMIRDIAARLGPSLKSAGNPNPGTGAFKRCVQEVVAKGGSYSPRGVCAAAGRKKYGKKKFQAMAKAGRTKRNAIELPTGRGPSAQFGNFKSWPLKDQWGDIHYFESKEGADQAYKRWTDSGQTVTRLPVTTTEERIAARKRNPLGLPIASLTQGKAKATVYKKLKGYEVRITRTRPKLLGGDQTQSFAASDFTSAMSIARLRLHDAAKNPITTEDMFGLIPGVHAVTVATKAFRPSHSRKNPIDKAAKMYEEFHGTPSTEVLEYITQEHRHSVTAGLGKLVSIKLITPTGKEMQLGGAAWLDSLKPADIVQVVTSEDGRQLFLKGGDQEIKDADLKAFGFTDADKHDHMLIGTIAQLTYRTRKSFEKGGKEEVDFYHDLGKEGSKGIMPVLLYNPRNKSMTIAGGRYKIAAPAKELGNVSPGIVG